MWGAGKRLPLTARQGRRKYFRPPSPSENLTTGLLQAEVSGSDPVAGHLPNDWEWKLQVLPSTSHLCSFWVDLNCRVRDSRSTLHTIHSVSLKGDASQLTKPAKGPKGAWSSSLLLSRLCFVLGQDSTCCYWHVCHRFTTSPTGRFQGKRRMTILWSKGLSHVVWKGTAGSQEHVWFAIHKQPLYKHENQYVQFSGLTKQFHKLTSPIADTPRWQSVWSSRAIEHTDILRCQKLHKFCIFKNICLAVENRGSLIRDEQNFPSNQRHSYTEHILKHNKGWSKMPQSKYYFRKMINTTFPTYKHIKTSNPWLTLPFSLLCYYMDTVTMLNIFVWQLHSAEFRRTKKLRIGVSNRRTITTVPFLVSSPLCTHLKERLLAIQRYWNSYWRQKYFTLYLLLTS